MNDKNKKTNDKILKNTLKYINFIIFITIIFYTYIMNQKKAFNSSHILNEIHLFEKNQKKIDDYEIQQFRIINSNNIILDKKKYKKQENPDISVILTIYNQAHYIHKSLRSIQNQSLKNIEIIIIDDCSVDNSTKIIELYAKEDERIIMVNHTINEGPIKSRTEGVKMAKGKYITIIDGDDAFIHENVLKNSIYIASLANIDIVEFKGAFYKNDTVIT